jgi:hypothetical protein
MFGTWVSVINISVLKSLRYGKFAVGAVGSGISESRVVVLLTRSQT